MNTGSPPLHSFPWLCQPVLFLCHAILLQLFYSEVLFWQAHPITMKTMLRVYYVMTHWAGLTWSQQQDAHNQSYLSIHTFSLWRSPSKVVTWFWSASLEASASDLSLLFSSSWLSSRCLCAWQEEYSVTQCAVNFNVNMQLYYPWFHMQLWFDAHTSKVDFSCLYSSVSLVTSSSRRRFNANRCRQNCSKSNSNILDLIHFKTPFTWTINPD